MFDRAYKHIWYYSSLILILIFGFILVYANSSNKSFQIGIVFVITLFYVFWGILHHFLKHDLNMKIVIEYMLIGCFGLGIILFLLKGGLGI